MAVDADLVIGLDQLEDRVQFAVETVHRVGRLGADIEAQDGEIGHDIVGRAAFYLRRVHRDVFGLKRLDAEDEVRCGDYGIAPLVRVAARMGAAAGNRYRVIARPAACMGECPVGQCGRLVGQSGIFPACQFLDESPAGETACFLVRIDHHIVAYTLCTLDRLEGPECMEDNVEPALHVGGAGTVDRLVIQPRHFLEWVVYREDRVHVTGQNEATFRLGANAKDHVLAVWLLELTTVRRYRRDYRRVYERDLAGKRRECIRENPGHLREPIDVRRAGIDRGPALNLAQHRIGVDCVEEGLRGTIRFHWQLP